MTDIPARKRVVLCRGQYCNIGRRADRLYQRIEAVVSDVNSEQRPVKLEIANCLSMCGAGPNLVLYPEGIAFNHMNDEALEQFISIYLRG